LKPTPKTKPSTLQTGPIIAKAKATGDRPVFSFVCGGGDGVGEAVVNDAEDDVEDDVPVLDVMEESVVLVSVSLDVVTAAIPIGTVTPGPSVQARCS
jgi:hypothetical protein